MQSLYGMLVPVASGTHAVQLPNGSSSILPRGAMTPPPDSSFPTRDALLDYLKKWAANHGYAVVIGRSHTNQLWIRCDRGGEYRGKHANDPSVRQRKHKESRLTGCEFSIRASMRKDGLWRSRCACPEHNHGPSEDLREHPSLRRMTDEQLNKVYELTALGESPADIMDELGRLWPDIKVIRRDIYNARKNFKNLKDTNSLPSSQVSASASSSTPASGTLFMNTSLEDPSGRLSGASESARSPWLNNEHVVTKKRKVGPSSRGSDTPATQSFASVPATASDGPSSQLDSFNSVPTATDSPLEEHPHNHSPWPQRPGSAQRAGVMSSTSVVCLPTTGTSKDTSLAKVSLRKLNGDFAFSAAGDVRAPNNDFTGAVAATTHLGAQIASLSHTPSMIPQAVPNGSSTALNMFSQMPNDYYAQHDLRFSSVANLQTVVSNQQPATTTTSPGASRRSSQLMASANYPPNVTQADLSSVHAVRASRPPSSAANELSAENNDKLTASANGQISYSNNTTASAQQPSTSSLQQQQLQQLEEILGQQQTRSFSSTLLLPQHAAPGRQLVPGQGSLKMQSGALLMQQVQRMEGELRAQNGVLNRIFAVVQNLACNGGGVLSAPSTVTIGEGPSASNGSS